jgi:hypothetical protein
MLAQRDEEAPGGEAADDAYEAEALRRAEAEEDSAGSEEGAEPEPDSAQPDSDDAEEDSDDLSGSTKPKAAAQSA